MDFEESEIEALSGMAPRAALHQMGNLLQPILGNLSLLKRRVAEEENLRACVDEILGDARKMKLALELCASMGQSVQKLSAGKSDASLRSLLLYEKKLVALMISPSARLIVQVDEDSGEDYRGKVGLLALLRRIDLSVKDEERVECVSVRLGKGFLEISLLFGSDTRAILANDFIENNLNELASVLIGEGWRNRCVETDRVEVRLVFSYE